MNNWNLILLISLLGKGEIDPLLLFCLQGLGAGCCTPGTTPTTQLPCAPQCPTPPTGTTTTTTTTPSQTCCCGGTQAINPLLIFLLLSGRFGEGLRRGPSFPGRKPAAERREK